MTEKSILRYLRLSIKKRLLATAIANSQGVMFV